MESSQHGKILPHCVLSAAQLNDQVLHLIYWVTSSEPVRTQTFYTFFEHSTHNFSSPFKQFISKTAKTSVINATWNSEQVQAITSDLKEFQSSKLQCF